MSERTYEEASVDLTEDEDSCEEYPSGATTGFHFVDCTSKIVPSPGISPIKKPATNVVVPPPLTPIRKFVTQQQSAKPTIRLKPLPKMIKKPETLVNSTPISRQKVGILNEAGGKSLLKVNRTFEQIKPTVNKVAESRSTPKSTQNNIEIVCLDSDGESSSKDIGEPVNPVPSTPIVPPPRPPGKMLIIKKNNKYYKIIIPHNVIPDINQSTGPVLINIPEVGPLVITSDHKGANPLQMQNTQLSLNLDDIGQGLSQDCVATKEVAVPPEPDKPVEDPEKSEKRALLYSNKFCWWYTRGRKRDLDGFTYYDRFGFSKAECSRARKCARNLELIVTKKRGELVKQVCKYEEFKKKDYVKVKIVEIDDIVTKKRGRKRKAKPATAVSADPLETRKRRKVSPKESEYQEYDSDLLLTKKVVILDGKNKETRDIYSDPIPGPSQPKRLRKTPFLKQMDLIRAKKTVKRQNFTPKPCYVQMTRDERVEEAYRKYRYDMEYNRTQKVNPKLKRRTKKFVNTTDLDLFTMDEDNATKLNTKTFYENIVKIFCTRIIDTEERFKKELNHLKPLLLVNEHNLSTLNYSAEFSKNNILYVVKEKYFPNNILRNEGFISGVELGYIKLVDSELFCKYVMNPVSFKEPQTDSYTSEHNYCFVKKK